MWAKLLAFLTPIAESEFEAVAPIAVSAVTELGSDELQAVQTGDLKDTGKILAAVTQNAANKAVAAGLSAVSPMSLLAAVGHAIATAPAPATK